MSEYLQRPVHPVEIEEEKDLTNFLESMSQTAFQGKNLALALNIWRAMLKEEMTIFFGLAGAMVPAGMRKVMVYLIKHRLIDCLVSTGANLYHDLLESLGCVHWQGSEKVDDLRLKSEGIDRIYDVFLTDTEFKAADGFLIRFTEGLEKDGIYSTRLYSYLLGKKLSEEGKEEGILSAAYKNGVPIYCPAISDSSIGIILGACRVRGTSQLQIDVVQDVIETTQMAIGAKQTGVIYIGGGTPKNFIQQTQVSATIVQGSARGHQYAIQVTTDSPQWGGLSGCTFEEAQSWGKISEKAPRVMLYCDATIALPLLVKALTKEEVKRPSIPTFPLSKKELFGP